MLEIETKLQEGMGAGNRNKAAGGHGCWKQKQGCRRIWVLETETRLQEGTGADGGNRNKAEGGHRH